MTAPWQKYSTAASRGPCVKCGQPVTWWNGLRNWFGELVHLVCPPPHDGGNE